MKVLNVAKTELLAVDFENRLLHICFKSRICAGFRLWKAITSSASHITPGITWRTESINIGLSSYDGKYFKNSPTFLLWMIRTRYTCFCSTLTINYRVSGVNHVDKNIDQLHAYSKMTFFFSIHWVKTKIFLCTHKLNFEGKWVILWHFIDFFLSNSLRGCCERRSLIVFEPHRLTEECQQKPRRSSSSSHF